MECTNCNLLQRKFFCTSCIKAHLREARSATKHVAAERSKHVERASKELPAIDKARQIRSEISSLEERVTEVRKETQRIKAAHEAARERITALKASLAERRNRLVAARALPSPSQSSSLQSFHSALSQMTETLAHTRAILVEELVEVFSIVEVGGRPSLGSTKGAKGEWMIGGLVLPVPGDMRRYPPEHINAALTHTLQFLNLLTFYLGVKLPFEVTWNGEMVGVGHPYIAAGKGSDSGGWARWSTKQPLHRPASSPSSSGAHGASPKSPATSSQTPSFTTALTMLVYNTLYLCHTQSLPIPLSQSGDVLRNLWALCCTPELGRRSHQTGVGAALEQPTPPAFTVEFTQLLQVTSAGPGQRKKRRTTTPRKLREPPEDEDAEDWDMLEADI
ncbi:UV radiation resistance protein/autophagy-related protein 14 [Gautieria morchelliformis]|nr:UV radiation resistance protein/autophagy-related protein 14 [Gautieria morchelliformis]